MLWGEAGEEAFGHGGEPLGAGGFDLGGSDGMVGAGGIAEDEFAGGAVHDEAGEEFVIGEFDGVEDVFRGDIARRVENAVEDLRARFVFAGVLEGGTEGASGGIEVMALEATEARGIVEERCAAFSIATQREDFFWASGGLGKIGASGGGKEALEQFDDEWIR